MVKVALLIGVSEYKTDLIPLPSAPNDLEAMQQVLKHPKIGGFNQVKKLLNPDLITIQTAIETIFTNCSQDDLVLLFFSGHGLIHGNGKVYFATPNTNIELLRSTAVSTSFVYDIVKDSPSRRKVIILDCCLSGRFGSSIGSWVGHLSKVKCLSTNEHKLEASRISKVVQGNLEQLTSSLTEQLEVQRQAGEKSHSSSIVQESKLAPSTRYSASQEEHSQNFVDIKGQLAGEGWAILTSAISPQCFCDKAELSLYSRYLVEGMNTGAADLDGNGQISLEELHQYAQEKVQAVSPAMNPQIYGNGEAIKIILAKASIDDPKLIYRKEVHQRTRSGKLSVIGRKILNRLRAKHRLPPVEAAAIEAEVMQPLREYKRKLQEYREALAEAIEYEYPLDKATRQDLKDFQQMLGLRDGDVEPVEINVISRRNLITNQQMLGLGREAISWQKSHLIKESPLSESANVETNEVEIYKKQKFAISDHQTSIEGSREFLQDRLSSERGVDYRHLRDLLAQLKWQEANQETSIVMLKATERERYGWLTKECLKTFPCTDLCTIDLLWVKYSNGRFGFSVQNLIWQEEKKNYQAFCLRVGWRKWRGLRSDYSSLTFSLEAPYGHLPVGVRYKVRGGGSCFLSRVSSCKL